MSKGIYSELRAHEKARSKDHIDKMRARNFQPGAWKIDGDPLATVRIYGSAITPTRSDTNYNAVERESSLVKWNDRDDTLIDRFDGTFT